MWFHAPAVAVAGDCQALGVGGPVGDERVDGSEEIVLAGVPPPGAGERAVKRRPIPVAAAGVDGEDDPASGGERVVREVVDVEGGGPGVVGSTVDVEKEGNVGRIWLGRSQHPPFDI